MRVLAIFALICAFFGFANAEILVASGAGYKKPLEEVVKIYEKQSGKKVNRIYGNLAQIIEQAKQSGKIDAIFGDEKFIAKSKLEVEKPQLVGYGKLVVVGSKDSGFKSLDDLKNAEKIALPDSKKAIYGVAGMEFLKNANLYKDVESKLMFLATVPQVTTYLSEGNVDVGLINISDYLALKDRLGAMIEVDSSLYTPILISIAKLSESKSTEIAEFMAFLESKEAVAIFKKYGLEH
ncbi:molybdate ABC transporter substrate-binding protein [Helicobacter sp. 16-1353]|uniref:molybdate ABC transporter substrate-binding protein n=1 Tax=Helicobacter sp. 16-1353 TaxID=2004996 RepID=UPI000DCEC386|nr:molybdate ABC transporter substrate-binding protein [Helicobacter sp. 16-1353]RAX52446.1 molybdate ABC transporter substrate-binding protein [Helicobacter sp. 16-1353]